jgi:hypothetical protein
LALLVGRQPKAAPVQLGERKSLTLATAGNRASYDLVGLVRANRFQVIGDIIVVSLGFAHG